MLSVGDRASGLKVHSSLEAPRSDGEFLKTPLTPPKGLGSFLAKATISQEKTIYRLNHANIHEKGRYLEKQLLTSQC
jgi:hypothetical protein